MLKYLIIILSFVAAHVAYAQDSRYTLGDGWQMLPYESIFKPPVADPEWPRMSAGYRHYTGNGPYALEDALEFKLGGTFPMIRKDFGGVELEFGIQGLGLMSFDLNNSSSMMIYADYFLGAPVFAKFTDKFTLMVRYYHRSAHLGDEMVIDDAEAENDRVVYDNERINLSYEVLDALLSYQITDIFRVYGGGGLVSNPQPYNYGTSVYQAGAEAESPVNMGLALIAAVDFKGSSGVAPGVSVEAGIKAFDGLTLVLAVSDGPGPAQFFGDRVTSYAINFNIY